MQLNGQDPAPAGTTRLPQGLAHRCDPHDATRAPRGVCVHATRRYTWSFYTVYISYIFSAYPAGRNSRFALPIPPTTAARTTSVKSFAPTAAGRSSAVARTVHRGLATSMVRREARVLQTHLRLVVRSASRLRAHRHQSERSVPWTAHNDAAPPTSPKGRGRQVSQVSHRPLQYFTGVSY
jgi:hypothetical protein